MTTLFSDDFSGDLANWWIEGGQRVWIQEGRLHVAANPLARKGGGFVCTVWCRKAFTGDVRVECDAHVLESLDDVNNINFFFMYTDPAGKPLHDTRGSRSDGEYRHYHGLNGYIFTYLNDNDAADGRLADGSTKARIRIRRCPGFELLSETFTHHCRRGITYRMAIQRAGGELSLAVDGRTLLRARDDRPHAGGLFGLRTFQTYLWFDNVTVRQL